MHIGALQTIRSSDNDNLLWLVLETDTGITGLGEAFFAPGAVENFVHEVIAPLVLGAVIQDAASPLSGYDRGYAMLGAFLVIGGFIGLVLIRPEADALRLEKWRIVVRDRV